MVTRTHGWQRLSRRMERDISGRHPDDRAPCWYRVEESDGAQEEGVSWSGRGEIKWRGGEPRPAPDHPAGQVSATQDLFTPSPPRQSGIA
jgi:hypothetical protein